VPFVTVMTDYDECAHGMWVSSPLQILICSSRRAAQRAARRGHPSDKILEASGLVISPSFYEPIPEDRALLRSRLGLAADVPAGLVMYGGQGASRMVQVARAMNRARYPLQLIFLCGRDRRTADAIRALSTGYPRSVHGFVEDVHRYMAAADFFVGKPGPSSIAEALAMGLPMVLDFDWRTMLQDRYNAAWAVESGVALLSRSMRELPERIHALLDRYADYRDAARAMSRGRALFDVAALLDGCLARAGAGSH
jgi:1,2-diacylglycerol 3-beta-galactosyltransferase